MPEEYGPEEDDWFELERLAYENEIVHFSPDMSLACNRPPPPRPVQRWQDYDIDTRNPYPQMPQEVSPERRAYYDRLERFYVWGCP